jgi:hypothetical protein
VLDGSGFMLSNDLIVTDSHVIPREANYKTMIINVRFRSRKNDPVVATLIGRDPENDLAILRISKPVPTLLPPCPIDTLTESSDLPSGTHVILIGFTAVADQDLIAPGIISGKDEVEGRWLTTAPLNIGQSGAPVFSEEGYLIGFGRSGITSIVLASGDSVPIYGVGFLIPAAKLLKGPLAKFLIDEPTCWRVTKRDVVNDWDIAESKVVGDERVAVLSYNSPIFTNSISALDVVGRLEDLQADTKDGASSFASYSGKIRINGKALTVADFTDELKSVNANQVSRIELSRGVADELVVDVLTATRDAKILTNRQDSSGALFLDGATKISERPVVISRIITISDKVSNSGHTFIPRTLNAYDEYLITSCTANAQYSTAGVRADCVISKDSTSATLSIKGESSSEMLWVGSVVLSQELKK